MPCRYEGDVDESIQEDIILLSCGYILVTFYASVILGNFSRMNTKVSVSSSDFCHSFSAHFRHVNYPSRSSGWNNRDDDKDTLTSVCIFSMLTKIIPQSRAF